MTQSLESCKMNVTINNRQTTHSAKQYTVVRSCTTRYAVPTVVSAQTMPTRAVTIHTAHVRDFLQRSLEELIAHDGEPVEREEYAND